MLIAALIAMPLAASAQNSQPQCTQPEHRQFDFWVGNWNVTSGNATAGTNDVTLEEGGCVVHEHWVGSKGSTGQSFNFYDRTDKQWHQIWVDNGGTWLNLAGTFADGKMVLTGHNKGPQGKALVQRITWTANPDGSVRQLWDTSSDDGKTWTVAFDGTYRKK
jgi:hypothetical protein